MQLYYFQFILRSFFSHLPVRLRFEVEMRCGWLGEGVKICGRSKNVL